MNPTFSACLEGTQVPVTARRLWGQTGWVSSILTRLFSGWFHLPFPSLYIGNIPLETGLREAASCFVVVWGVGGSSVARQVGSEGFLPVLHPQCNAFPALL